MKKCNKALIALLIGTMSIVGMAGIASARGGHGYSGNCGGYGGGYGHGGYGHGGRWHGGPGPAQWQGANMSPELQETLQKSHAATAPLFMELQAKRQELTAKIYSGADDKTVQDLKTQVNTLQARLNDARVDLQKQLAKAGVPLGPGMSNCPGFGGGLGFHGPRHGYGFHSQGYGPCYGGQQAPVTAPQE